MQGWFTNCCRPPGQLFHERNIGLPRVKATYACRTSRAQTDLLELKKDETVEAAVYTLWAFRTLVSKTMRAPLADRVEEES